MRIVSLLPSATEIVARLGLKDYLVGRSHECDYPAEITSLPVLTGPKFKSDGSSKGINQEVSRLVKEGLSVYWVNSELLDKLQPDFILTQSQCEVCAVSMKDVENAVCEIISSNPRIINLEPLGYKDLFLDFLNAGTILNRKNEANQLVNDIKSGIEDIYIKTKSLNRKKTVSTIEWLEPMMNAGNWIPTVIEKAGGINHLGTESEHSHYITIDDLVSADSEVIIIMPCGFDIQRSLEEIELLTKHDEWENLKAVKAKQVYITDGNQYFNRPGPRVLESVQIIAEILYPDLFSFGHQGKGWIRL